MKKDIQSRASELVANAMGRHEKLKEADQQRQADPNEAQWADRKLPPRANSRPAAGRKANTWVVPTAPDVKRFAEANPDLMEGYSPTEDFAEYQLPASREWFGVRAALWTLAASRVGYDFEKAIRYLHDYLGQHELADQISRSQVSATPSAGGALQIPQMLAGEFIPLLRKAIALYTLGVRQIPLTGDSTYIPGMAAGTSGGWVGELGHGSVSSFRVFRRKLTAKKAYALAAISRDLQEESSMPVAMMLRDDLVLALAEVVEDGCINGLGTENSPRGLLNYLGLASSAFGAPVDIYTFQSWKRTLRENNVSLGAPRKIGTLFAPAVEEAFANLASPLGAFYYRSELESGKCAGFPAAVSNFIAVAANTTSVIHGDFSQVIVGVSRDVTIETSKDASFTDEDGSSRNAFLDEVDLVKVTKKCDLAVRQTKALIVDKTITVD